MALDPVDSLTQQVRPKTAASQNSTPMKGPRSRSNLGSERDQKMVRSMIEAKSMREKRNLWPKR